MKHELISGAAAAAEYLGLPRRQIYRLAEEGQLPCVRKGRRLFFLRSELQRAFAGSSRFGGLASEGADNDAASYRYADPSRQRRRSANSRGD